MTCAAAALLLAPLALAGCSGEIKGLASGGSLSRAMLASATVDQLTTQNIPILVMPVCTISPQDVNTLSCLGKSTESEAITVTVPDALAKPPIMTILVGNKQVFQGSVAEVLDDALLVK